MTTTQPAYAAFHGQQAIKDRYLNMLQTDRTNRVVSEGIFWKANGPDWDDMYEGRARATAYVFHDATDPYGSAELQLGVPRNIALLLDQVSDNMTPARQAIWPGQFLEAIPLGADLARIWPQLAVWMLFDTQFGLMRYAQQPDQREGIQGAADLFTKLLYGEEVTQQEWLSAQETADAAHARASTIAMDASMAMAASMAARYAANGDTAAAVDDAEATHTCNSNAAQAATNGAASACTIAATPLTAEYCFYSFIMSGAMAYSFSTMAAGASITYYDELGDQLLALLATAPVPARG